MTTPSVSIRIRPDLVSGTCRLWPRVGLRNLRDPHRLYPPFHSVYGKAWKLRIRPDLATKIYPEFPGMRYEDWILSRQEQRAKAENFVIG